MEAAQHQPQPAAESREVDGTVDRELILSRDRRARSTGTVRSGPTVYEFTDRDLARPSVPLRAGDAVRFVPGVDRRSQRPIATRVRLVQCVPAGRERGVVHVVRGDSSSGGSSVPSYGFIKVAGGGGEIFFHRSALVDVGAAPSVGDCLEFDAVQAEDGRYAAMRITRLPKGSVSVDEGTSEQRLTGVLDSEYLPAGSGSSVSISEGDAPAASAGSPRSTVRSGSVSCVLDGEAVSLPFASSDCTDPRGVLLKGDRVSFLVSRHRGPPRAVSVQLETEGEEAREAGIVVSINANGTYAFVRRAEPRDPDLFLHASQMQGPEFDRKTVTIKEGTELSFAVFKGDNGRLSAVRARLIEKGTVKLQKPLPCTATGVLLKSARKGKQGAGAVRVESIEMDDGAPGDLTSLPISKGDSVALLDSAGALLLTGDRVRFRVLVHCWTGSLSVDAVTVTEPRQERRERGLVESVDSDSHMLTIACESRLGTVRARVEGTSATVAWLVGDAAEFDVVDNAAVRVTKLDATTTNVRRYDASAAKEHGTNRGRVESIPTNATRGPAAPGSIAVLESSASDAPASVSFHFRDISAGSFLGKGDEVSFEWGHGNPLQARAVRFLPRHATITRVNDSASPVTGSVTLMAHSSNGAEEQCTFTTQDFVAPPPGPLSIGDVVEVGDMAFDAARKKRVARKIKFVKSAPTRAAPARDRASQQFTNSANRFARGPPSADAKGFQSRQKYETDPANSAPSASEQTVISAFGRPVPA